MKLKIRVSNAWLTIETNVRSWIALRLRSASQWLFHVGWTIWGRDDLIGYVESTDRERFNVETYEG